VLWERWGCGVVSKREEEERWGGGGGRGGDVRCSGINGDVGWCAKRKGEEKERWEWGREVGRQKGR
jgi:hypothetical protein